MSTDRWHIHVHAVTKMSSDEKRPQYKLYKLWKTDAVGPSGGHRGNDEEWERIMAEIADIN